MYTKQGICDNLQAETYTKLGIFKNLQPWSLYEVGHLLKLKFNRDMK